MHLIETNEIHHYDKGILVKSFCMQKIHSKLQSAYISIPPGALTPTDSHKVKECWFITSGTGELILPKNILLKEGDFIHFAPFEKHAIKNKSKNMLKILSIWWPE